MRERKRDADNKGRWVGRWEGWTEEARRTRQFCRSTLTSFPPVPTFVRAREVWKVFTRDKVTGEEGR